MDELDERPPGWYADPASGGRVRWWDGVRWTVYEDPPPPADEVQTDTLAIVALVTALLWVPVAPVLLGALARRRIREAERPRRGGAVATAAVGIGVVQLVMLSIVMIAVVSTGIA